MNVSLTPELEKFVTDTVATGRYASASEVIRSSLRSFAETERMKEHIRVKIQRSLGDLAAGRVTSRERLRAELKERRKKRA